jgi:RND superfamily putative drug exporter
MVAVFLGFASEVDVVVKQLGVGMAVAILLDATVVRMVLVPATMSLLGDWNWWVPRWLDRFLPHVRAEVEEDDVELWDDELHDDELRDDELHDDELEPVPTR